MTEKKKRILVCPLDWGIGHATRCIPLIQCLEENGAEVVVGASGNPLAFLRQARPDLSYIDFPGLVVNYPSDGRMVLKMLRSAPGIIRVIRKEHRLLDHLIREHRIDGVVSDNRFGLWSRKVPSVYITHQIMIKAPDGLGFLEPFLFGCHRWFIGHYDQCWVPDHPGEENLSGDLSHRYTIRGMIRFIGPMSRFDPRAEPCPPPGAPDRADLLALLSGPEPLRSLLEKIILEQANGYPDKEIVILQGLPGKPHPGKIGGHITVYSHLPDDQMLHVIRVSQKIICRPGYSTIMDLNRIGKKAFLIPTPGQTEQEYLAQYHEKKGIYAAMKQNSVNLQDVFSRDMGADPGPPDNGTEALNRSVRSFLKMIP